jgi:hypothetical protein
MFDQGQDKCWFIECRPCNDLDIFFLSASTVHFEIRVEVDSIHMLCILGVPALSLDPDAGCPDWDLSLFSSVPLGKFRNSALD